MTAIIVEDGTVVSGSNSYVTVSGIDAYATDYGIASWTDTAITNAMKEAAVFKSMRYLEGLNWNGVKNTQAQDLEWPRAMVFDKNGYLIPTTEIPKAVIKAQCEVAILFLPDGEINLQPNFTKDDYSTYTGITGATAESWANLGAVRPTSTAVKDILKGLTKSSMNILVERN